MSTRNESKSYLTVAASVVAFGLFFAATGTSDAGVFTSVTQNDWGAEISGIGYTHAVNFGGSAISVNGVSFETSTGIFTDGNTTYSDGPAADGVNNIVNDAGLADNFKHDGDTVAALHFDPASLIADNLYELKMFFVDWDGNPRETTITDDFTADSIVFNLTDAGSQNGTVVTYNYTAQANGALDLSFVFTVTNDAGHFYALTNQDVTPIPEPSAFVLAALGLLSLGMTRRRRRR
jgi:hypothetical protein